MLNDIILLLHQYNPYLIVAASAITGIWGFILWFRKSQMVKPWRISMGITICLGLVQAILGLIMLTDGRTPGDNMHYLYGGLVALALPLVWQLFTTNGKDPRRDLLIYSGVAVLVAGLAIRAWTTGY